MTCSPAWPLTNTLLSELAAPKGVTRAIVDLAECSLLASGSHFAVSYPSAKHLLRYGDPRLPALLAYRCLSLDQLLFLTSLLRPTIRPPAFCMDLSTSGQPV